MLCENCSYYCILLTISIDHEGDIPTCMTHDVIRLSELIFPNVIFFCSSMSICVRMRMYHVIERLNIGYFFKVNI